MSKRERERFEAQGWDLGSIEEACAELERLSALARAYAAETAIRNIEIARLEVASGLRLT